MVVISGRYRYMPKVYIDYLSEKMPDVHFCTKIPNDADGRPVVTVSTQPAGSHTNRFMAWRWLVFGCHARTELAAGELCEQVRAQVWQSRYDNICHQVLTIGEPARFDLLDEPTPRFQTILGVLLREIYLERKPHW